MTDEEFNSMRVALAAQNAEFEALDKLMDAARAHNATPVVDDDYPAVRHRYEGALADFIKAMKANQRFSHQSNRYGVVDKEIVGTYADVPA
jgi:hypothetical protein